MTEEISKDKKYNIVSAARKVFARYGFSKTTMEDIAAEAEMAKASLYYYFPAKENLFFAVLLQEQNEFIERIDVIISKENSCEEKLKVYVNERSKFFRMLVNLGTLTYSTFLEKKAIHKKPFYQIQEKEILIIDRIIEEGKTSGEFREDVHKKTAALFVHIVTGLRLRIMKLYGSSPMDDVYYKQLHNELNLMADIFIRGLKSKSNYAGK